MRGACKKALLILAITFPLAGCNSIFGGHLFARGASKPHQMARQDAAIAQTGARTGIATQAGRDALDTGRPGEAIEQFRKALLNNEPAAPALNGLAVAYARIGRHDLARRYFEQAVVIDPANPRYRANLAQLRQSRMLATQQRDADRAAKLALNEARTAAPAPQAQDLPQPPRPGQLQRVSRNEVRIAAAPAYPAPVARERMVVGTRGTGIPPGADLKGFKPIIRVAFADVKPAVRVDTVDARTDAAADAEPVANAGARPLARLALPTVPPGGPLPVIERQ